MHYTVWHLSIFAPCLSFSLTLFHPPFTLHLFLLLTTILHLVPSVFSCFSRVFLLIPDFPRASPGCVHVYVHKARCLLFGLCLSVVLGLGREGSVWERQRNSLCACFSIYHLIRPIFPTNTVLWGLTAIFADSVLGVIFRTKVWIEFRSDVV